LVFRAFPADRRLCVFRYLSQYLARTVKSRKIFTSLFLTYQKPIHPASRETLSRWAKLGLKEAGIDVTQFSSHSYRGASVSAAQTGGASLDEILQTAGWSNTSTFATFYNRPLLNRADLKSYDQAVLGRKRKK